MIAKQKKLLIVFAGIFILLLVAYLAFIRPAVNAPDEETVTEPLETTPGEYMTPGGQLFMYPQIPRASMQSVAVTNEHGTYEFYRDADGNFQIRGFEGTPYDSTLFSSLVTTAGYTITKTKVVDNATEAELAEYGLDNPQATWTVTSVTGASYTVQVGYDLLTGGGYYCMVEGRRSVYVLGNEIAQTMFAPIETLCSPVFIAGISQNDYYTIDNIVLLAYGEELCRITRLDPALHKNPQALVEYKMDYPEGYTPNDGLVTEMLYTFTSVTGTSVVKIGPTAEDAAAYGLTNPAFTVGFTYMNVPVLLFFSELQENGTYNVQSTLFPHMIVAVDAATLPFIKTDLLSWVKKTVFNDWLVTLAEIETVGSGADVLFTLTHGVAENGNATLDVVSDTGKVIPNAEVNNFRQFYKTMLTMEIKDTVPLSDEEIAALAVEENCILTVRLKTIAGVENVYRFYPYSSTGRRALLTVNGNGEFYVETDLVKKIASDANKVLNDLDVDAYAKD